MPLPAEYVVSLEVTQLVPLNRMISPAVAADGAILSRGTGASVTVAFGPEPFVTSIALSVDAKLCMPVGVEPIVMILPLWVTFTLPAPLSCRFP